MFKNLSKLSAIILTIFGIIALVLIIGGVVVFVDVSDGVYDLFAEKVTCNRSTFFVKDSIKATRYIDNENGDNMAAINDLDENVITLDPGESDNIFARNSTPNIDLVKDLDDCFSSYEISFYRYYSEDTIASKAEKCTYDSSQESNYKCEIENN
ncbi:MAG: hypothetical protein AAGF07_01675 [Patescibacteria group bacterium]